MDDQFHIFIVRSQETEQLALQGEEVAKYLREELHLKVFFPDKLPIIPSGSWPINAVASLWGVSAVELISRLHKMCRCLVVFKEKGKLNPFASSIIQYFSQGKRHPEFQSPQCRIEVGVRSLDALDAIPIVTIGDETKEWADSACTYFSLPSNTFECVQTTKPEEISRKIFTHLMGRLSQS